MRHRDAADIVLAEKGLQRHRRRELARADQGSRDLEDAAMNLLDEMLASEKIRDAVEGVVVDEDRAEQRLLGVEIVRRRAIGALRGGDRRCGELFDRRHGLAARLSLDEVLVKAENTNQRRATQSTRGAAQQVTSAARRRSRQSGDAKGNQKNNSGEKRGCHLDGGSRLSLSARDALAPLSPPRPHGQVAPGCKFHWGDAFAPTLSPYRATARPDNWANTA